jgi:hypothetical protein
VSIFPGYEQADELDLVTGPLAGVIAVLRVGDWQFAARFMEDSRQGITALQSGRHVEVGVDRKV